MESTLEIPDKVLQIMTAMEERISQLEAKLQMLQSRNDDLWMHSMREQSKQHVKDLERIWGFDKNKNYDINKIRGVLAGGPEHPNSVELVRSIRDGDDDDDD